MKTNRRVVRPAPKPATENWDAVFTHEGAPAVAFGPTAELRRAVSSCLLWEDTFYESGEDIAKRIADLVPLVPPTVVALMAEETRVNLHLRHIPLFLVAQMCRHDGHRELVAATLPRVIRRADELAEFLAIYWTDQGGRKPIPAQAKTGLADAFARFDEYHFAKYKGDGDTITLRDVMRLVHPKPADEARSALYARIRDGKLATPDTWEVALSRGDNKRETWIRLIEGNKLGGRATLSNLRNMQKAGVPEDVIRRGLQQMNVSQVLPFRFIAAARFGPQFEPELEQALFRNTSDMPKLPGRTHLLVDVSGSMDEALASYTRTTLTGKKVEVKSDMNRIDAACGLAMVLREMCEEVRIWSFSNDTRIIAPRRGFALRNAIVTSQEHIGTHLGAAVQEARRGCDRLIVISDEQSHDPVADPQGRGYMLNVASYKNGVGYGDWVRIDGFSEAVVRYVLEAEKNGVLD